MFKAVGVSLPYTAWNRMLEEIDVWPVLQLLTVAIGMVD
jgi:hypothetical protein